MDKNIFPLSGVKHYMNSDTHKKFFADALITAEMNNIKKEICSFYRRDMYDIMIALPDDLLKKDTLLALLREYTKHCSWNHIYYFYDILNKFILKEYNNGETDRKQMMKKIVDVFKNLPARENNHSIKVLITDDTISKISLILMFWTFSNYFAGPVCKRT